MAATEFLLTDVQALERGSQTQALELAYERTLRKSDLIYEAEKLRKFRVDMALLEDDNEDLHVHLSHADDRVDDLEKSEQELQVNLQATESRLESTQAELRSKCREVGNLKTELKSLNDVSANATKLLTEKLALIRELASLKPELEHFRSQAVLHQSTLAEKLSLQRQLSSVQVELQTEKNATQRALAREDGRQEVTENMESRLEELQSELMQERRDRQKAERELQQISSDFEAKKTVIESRLKAFRNKLRTTKDQLKEVQTELQEARKPKVLSIDIKGSPGGRERTKESRKRNLAQVDADATIGTPGIVPPAKRGKRGSTIPGDKSTFSITPYLNKTTSIAPESPIDGQTLPEDKQKANLPEKVRGGRDSSKQILNVSEKPASVTSDQMSDSSLPPKKRNVLTTIKASRSNCRGVSARTAIKQSALEKVQEENDEMKDEENLPPVNLQPVPSQAPTERIVQDPEGFANDGPTFIKRKRKLLGGGLSRTLFDDDDESGKRSSEVIPKSSRAFGAIGKGGLGKNDPRLPGPGGIKGLGAFSPLKKDRKTARNQVG